MTDKQKNIALVFGFLLLLIISYLFAFKRTLELKNTLQSFKTEKELLSNANQRIFKLQQENKYLDSILVQKNISISNSFQQTLLSRLNDFSKKQSIEIISFNEPHIYSENGSVLKTYSFEVKAGFNDLLKIMNTFEKQQLGAFISVNFEKKKNYRKNTDELIGTFFIQKMEQQK